MRERVYPSDIEEERNRELLWLRRQLKELNQTLPVRVYERISLGVHLRLKDALAKDPRGSQLSPMLQDLVEMHTPMAR